MNIASIEEPTHYDTLPTPLSGSSSGQRWLALVPIIGFVVNHIIQSQLNQLFDQKNLSQEDRYCIYEVQQDYITAALVPLAAILLLPVFIPHISFNYKNLISLCILIESFISAGMFFYYQNSHLERFNDWGYTRKQVVRYSNQQN